MHSVFMSRQEGLEVEGFKPFLESFFGRIGKQMQKIFMEKVRNEV